jgi:hypothetical protein
MYPSGVLAPSEGTVAQTFQAERNRTPYKRSKIPFSMHLVDIEHVNANISDGVWPTVDNMILAGRSIYSRGRPSPLALSSGLPYHALYCSLRLCLPHSQLYNV